MRKAKFLIVSMLILAFTGSLMILPAYTAQNKTYDFPFISHGGQENPFWSQVYVGYKDALKKFECKGHMYRPPREGDLAWQLRTWKAVLARKPDGIITTIPDEKMFDSVIKQAIDMGIPVLSANTDDPEGAKGNARLAYIGQPLVDSGYMLAEKAITKYFPGGPPAPQDLYVLLTMGAPGETWCQMRAEGIINFLHKYGVPEKNIYKLDTTMKADVIQSRVVAYLAAHPKTNLVLSTQYSIGGYLAAKSLGKKPGEITIAGFDLVPTVLDGIEEGYIAFTINQQPYLQGYLPVVELYLMKETGITPVDINTSMAVVDKTNVKEVRERLRVTK
ncbi:substrate-binding domain-containing protein [Candidatus Aerophobetes bacterium]|nr:substrate-binding domain-containing protein [Candidatus Aerophobetes bacterium]